MANTTNQPKQLALVLALLFLLVWALPATAGEAATSRQLAIQQLRQSAVRVGATAVPPSKAGMPVVTGRRMAPAATEC